MLYRSDTKLDRQISSLGFGCMRFPRTAVMAIDQKAVEALVLQACESGVNYFDTAYAYPGSEESLGKVLAAHPELRSDMIIATKLPHGMCKRIEDVERIFETSCSRLQTTCIDNFLVHNVVSFDQWQRLVDMGICEWVQEKREQGRLRAFGFSFHGSYSEFEPLIDAYDWDFVQIQYNYLNENYQAGRAGLELAEARQIPVIIMEPLLGGRLVANLPAEARAVMDEQHPDWSPVEWALRWLWDQPGVTCVLSGMNAPEQLAENVRIASDAAPGLLSENDYAAYERIKRGFESAQHIPCTGCNYCLPCPKGISIPACFAACNESRTLGWFTGVFNYLTSTGAANREVHLASDCIECGACKRKCPQHIDIPAELKVVRKRLEPPGLRFGLKAYAKIMGK